MRIKTKLITIFSFVLYFFTIPVFASTTSGTILNTDSYAWGENMAWINFAPVNASSTYEGLIISDNAITGYAWSKKDGWINFSPTASGQGVTNTGGGVLGGFAWSTLDGWISMSGVTIDNDGKFKGVAGSATSTAGRISFDCDNCSVKTDWRPVSIRNQANNQVQQNSAGNGMPIQPDNISISNKLISDYQKIVLKNKIDNVVVFELPKIDSYVNRNKNSVEAYNTELAVLPTEKGIITSDLGSQKVNVEIPKGISDDSLNLNIDQKPAGPISSNLIVSVIGQTFFDITARKNNGEEVHTFSKPLKITITLANSFTGKYFNLYWFDTLNNTWVLVPDVVFTDKTATFYVDHLTRFALFETKKLEKLIPIQIEKTSSSSYNHFLSFWWIILVIIILFILRKKITIFMKK